MVIFLTKKRNVLIVMCSIIFVVAVYLMLLGNTPKLAENNEEDSAQVIAGIEVEADSSRVMAEKDSDFFIDYRLERDRLRGQEADYLRELINNPNASSEAKEKAQQNLIELSKRVEKEMIAENLIKAKGYEDAILFVSDDYINVVVKSEGLEAKDIAQITDAITKSTGASLDRITIIERK